MADRKWFKGRAALELDGWYRAGDVATNLYEGAALLRDIDTFADIYSELRDRDRWSDNSDFRYPRHDPLQGPEFETVARQGFLEAIALALRHDPPVPIETFWMTGVGNDRFEMHVTDATDKVSVTLLIPDADGGTEEPGSPESWVVRFDADGELEVVQTSGPLVADPPSATSAA